MNIVIANEYYDLLQNINIQKQCYRGIYDIDQLGSSFNNVNYQSVIIDVTAIKGYEDVEVIKKLTRYIDYKKLFLFLNEYTITQSYLNELVLGGIYNFANEINGLVYLLGHPNEYKDVEKYNISNPNSGDVNIVPQLNNNRNSKIIGFYNLTEHAGATTLIYYLVKLLKKKYNVIGVEVDKNDFAYFNSNFLISTIENKINYVVNSNGDKDVIFVDLNNSEKAIDICEKVFYLVEPTTIKVNKLITSKPNVFSGLFDKKMVLNKCALSSGEIAEFENEAHLKTFCHIGLINERSKSNVDVIKFLTKIGYRL